MSEMPVAGDRGDTVDAVEGAEAAAPRAVPGIVILAIVLMLIGSAVSFGSAVAGGVLGGAPASAGVGIGLGNVGLDLIGHGFAVATVVLLWVPASRRHFRRAHEPIAVAGRE